MSDAFHVDPSEQLDENTNTYPAFDDLVGDGKKYSDKEAAAKAIAEKDRFIKRLLDEAREKEAALAKRINEEEFLTKLEQITKTKSPDAAPPELQRDEENKSALSTDDVERLIEEREAKRSREHNLTTVLRKLEDVYGPDFKRRVQAQATEIGMTTAEITDLAARNPNAVFKLLGVSQAPVPQKDTFSPPPRSQVNPSFNTPSNKKDYAYWADQRRQKGEAWYFSGATQKQIWDAVKDMGEPEFYKRST